MIKKINTLFWVIYKKGKGDRGFRGYRTTFLSLIFL
jgi:hypothetical protein